jgi:CHAT domain-containing protein/Tfp pilus assembly protein PilF
MEQRLEGLTLRREGLELMRAGDLAAGLQRLDRALAIFRQVGDRAGEAGVLDTIAVIYRRDGQYARARDLFEQVLSIGQQLGDRELVQGAHLGLGLVYDDLSELGRALDHLEQSLTLTRELAAAARAAGQGGQLIGQLAGEFSTLNNIAAVHRQRGEYAQALERYQQALAIGRALDPREPHPLRLDNLGALTPEVVLELSQEAQGRALSNLGLVYDGLGQYERALEHFLEAVAIARGAGRPHDLAVALTNAGTAYDNLDQYERALEQHQEALALARAMGNRPAEKTVLNNLAVIYRNQGQYALALTTTEQALALARQLGDRPGEAVTLGNIGAIHDNLGQHARASEFHRQAAALARDVGDRPAEAIFLSNLGDSHERLGDLPQALAHYRQAIALNEDVRTAARIEELKTSLAERAATLYTRATLLLHRLGQPAEAFELAERARARTLLDQLGNARLDLARRADPSLAQQEETLRAEIGNLDRQLRQEQARPGDQRSAERVAALYAELSSRQTAYADLITQLKLADPESAALVSVAPLTLAEVQRLLPADTTLLSYYVSADKTLAFVVGRDRFQAVELAVGEPALRAATEEFRAFADPSDTRPASLQRLADWLLAPLAGQLTTPVVGVVPHGILHYLPFAALPQGTGYFGDAHTLFYLPSASTLPFIQNKRKGRGDTLLAVAQSRPEGLPPLRFADVEAEAVARLYGARAITDAAATEAAFRAQAPTAAVLHVAAHGELNAANPLFSRLFLAPDAQHDGSLTVQDVYGLDLASAELVVLSACETQLGRQSRGDDLVGLNRAFIYAGTPSVIASLWSVNDPATAVLMAAFHQHLRAGLSKAAALQAAQAETRQVYPHPYYWAAFVLTGDPSPVGTGLALAPGERYYN